MSQDFIRSAAEQLPNSEPFFIIHIHNDKAYTALCLGDDDPEGAREDLIAELRELADILEEGKNT